MNNNQFFKNSNDTLKNISFDKTNKESLCVSSKNIINFDKVCDNYKKIKKINGVPKSNDGLWISEDNMTFIEFKNGNLDNHAWYELLQKNYDSLLILFDINFENREKILQNNLSFSREFIDYILVYNKDKNPHSQIHNSIYKKSGDVVYRLQSQEGYLFHKVKMMDSEEFMNQIEPLI